MSSFTPVNPQWRLQKPDCTKRYWFGPDEDANHESLKHVPCREVNKNKSVAEQQLYLKEKLSRRLTTTSTFAEARKSKKQDSGICLDKVDTRISSTKSMEPISKMILTSDILPTEGKGQSCQNMTQNLEVPKSYIKESTALLRQSLASLTTISCKKRLLSPCQDSSKPSDFQSMAKKRKVLVVVPVLDKNTSHSFKGGPSHKYNTRSRSYEETHAQAQSEHRTSTLSQKQSLEQSRHKISREEHKDISARISNRNNYMAISAPKGSDRGSILDVSINTVSETQPSKQPGTTRFFINDCQDSSDDESHDSDTITVNTSGLAPPKPLKLRKTVRLHPRTITGIRTTKTQHNCRKNERDHRTVSSVSLPVPTPPTPPFSFKDEHKVSLPRYPSTETEVKEEEKESTQWMWNIIGRKGVVEISGTRRDVGDVGTHRCSGCE